MKQELSFAKLNNQFSSMLSYIHLYSFVFPKKVLGTDIPDEVFLNVIPTLMFRKMIPKSMHLNEIPTRVLWNEIPSALGQNCPLSIILPPGVIGLIHSTLMIDKSMFLILKDTLN